MSTLSIAPFDLPAAFLEMVARGYAKPTLRHFDTVAAGPGWQKPLEVARAAIAEHLSGRSIDVDPEAALFLGCHMAEPVAASF